MAQRMRLFYAAVVCSLIAGPAVAGPKCSGEHLGGEWATTINWSIALKTYRDKPPVELFEFSLECDVKLSRRGASLSGFCYRGFDSPHRLRLRLHLDESCTIGGTGHLSIDYPRDEVGTNEQAIEGWLTPGADMMVLNLKQTIDHRTFNTGRVVAYRRP